VPKIASEQLFDATVFQWQRKQQKEIGMKYTILAAALVMSAAPAFADPSLSSQSKPGASPPVENPSANTGASSGTTGAATAPSSDPSAVSGNSSGAASTGTPESPKITPSPSTTQPNSNQ
jgi:hypothetical protein